MKVQSRNQTAVEAHGDIKDLGQVSIRDQSVSKFFSIVTEKLYENPIKAVTREIMTNMVDAWMQSTDSGDSPPPGKVVLPEPSRPTIRFVDYGPGMSQDEIELYVLHILESSKDEGNEYHGGWGLGLKSPFAYTKQWTIESRRDGYRTRYATFMQDSGVPTVSELERVEIGDGTMPGLTVELPVERSDFDEFKKWAKWYSTYLPAAAIDLPQVTDLKRPDYDDTWRGTADVEGIDPPIRWAYRTEDGMVRPGANWKRKRRYSQTSRTKKLTRIVLGHIVYDRLPDKVDGHAVQSLPLDIFVPIGSLQVTPDRDRLAADSDQIKRMTAILDEVLDELVGKFKQSISTKVPFRTLAHRSDSGLAQVRSLAIREISSSQDDTFSIHDCPVDFTPRPRGYAFQLDECIQATEDWLDVTNEKDPDDFKCWTLRHRDYVAPSQVNSRVGTINIDHTLQRIYYNDVGHGAIQRFKRIPLQKRNRWNSSDRETLLLLNPESNNYYAKIARINRSKVARTLGIPEDMLVPLSKAPQEQVSSNSISSSTPSSGNGKSSNDYHPWTDHNLVRVLYSTNRHYLHTRKWRDRDDMDDGGFFVKTHAGGVDVDHWPSTTGNNASEDWQFLRHCPNQIWNPVEDYITFLPGSQLDLAIQHDEWKNFFTVFRQRFLDYVNDKFDFEHDRIIRTQHNSVITTARNRLTQLKRLAKQAGIKLPRELTRLDRYLAKTFDLRGASLGVNTTLAAHLLDVDDVDQNTRNVKARVQRVTRHFPALELVNPLKPRNCQGLNSHIPREQDAYADVIRSIVQHRA